MNQPAAVLTTLSRPARPPALLERLGSRAVRERLAMLRDGRLTLVDADERLEAGDAESSLSATVHVHDPAFYAAVALRGTVGAGESFARGHWSADDLPAVVRVILRNRQVLAGIEGGLARLARPLLRLGHALRGNTRAGSRRNIAAHYDLGDDFFAAFLDETMTYSCGVFERPESTLAEAAVAKIDRACRKLRLSPDDHLLEIGTGWGALAVHAASRYGCRVTTTTISERQHETAVRRVAAAGLADRVSVLKKDYRDLSGRFDKLVSIEMIEAVGFDHLDEFFTTCDRLLVPEGLMLLQAITMADQHHDGQLRQVDFIKRHVFPGSHIPSVAVLADRVARCTDFQLVHLEALTPHYVRTLAEWRRNLLAAREGLRAAGYGEELLRGFEFYLAYCEAGFAERYLGDVQALLAGPQARHPAVLPPLDAFATGA